jgi:hypothetical protein
MHIYCIKDLFRALYYAYQFYMIRSTHVKLIVWSKHTDLVRK